MIQTAGMLTDGKQKFYLEALRPIEDIYEARKALSHSFVGLLCAMAVIGSLAAMLLSHWLTGSLTALAETARAITEGDLSRRADEQGQDEIGQLARDLIDIRIAAVQKYSGAARCRRTAGRIHGFVCT